MVSQLFRYTAIALYLLFTISAHTQQPETKPPTNTGSVDGSVTFADTRLPARFAEIRLVPKPSDALAATQDVSAQEQSAQGSPKPHVSTVTGVSDMEGRFHLEGIPAGDYLAAALMAGFVGPGIDPATNPSDELLKPIIASFPTVHVSEGQIATLNLTLHRGGVITGRILYSDGSPATGIQVSWEAPVLPTFEQTSMRPTWPRLQAMWAFISSIQADHRAKTDDQGRYRIYGLSPGKYIVDTALLAQVLPARVSMSDGNGFGGGSPSRMYPNLATVYAPGVFRRSDARVFEIRGDEEISDADLKLDPSGLHSVKGRVLAGEDRHVPSQAMIRVKENGKLLDRVSMLEPDGSFEIAYLPSSTYTLQILGSPDETSPANPNERPQPIREYQMAEQAVIVENHDVTLDDVVLVPLKPGERQRFPE